MEHQYTIAVAGTGYVGLSIATLLAQHNKVYAVDIVPEKVDLINQRKSPIQDEYIEKYLAEISTLRPRSTAAMLIQRRRSSSSPRPPTTTARRISLIPRRWKLSSRS